MGFNVKEEDNNTLIVLIVNQKCLSLVWYYILIYRFKWEKIDF